MRSIHVILLSLLLSLVMQCGAQTKTPEITSPSSDYSKEAYVVEKISTAITVEDDGSNVREITAEVRIMADAGVKALAVLHFTYTSANEVVDVDYVRVQKTDGGVVKTPEYNIQEMPADVTRAAPMYSDVREKQIAVKGLGVGDLLEYKIRFRVAKPQIPGELWYEHSFGKSEIVRNERVELSVPKTKHFTVKSPDFKPEIKDEGDRKVYRWKYSYDVRKEEDEEALAMTSTVPAPSIQVTTFSNWEEIGNWYADLQKDQLVVTPAIEAKAKELTHGLSTDDEKLRAIYKFVSLRIHYVGLDFGIGRFQPHAADDVLGNEYGDCKDKHTLFASLLKAAGYEAWPALIHASQKLDVDVPSLAQFNHVITVVPRGDKLIWLDTTPEVAPYELLMQVLRDRQALVIPNGKAPVLMTTPANPPFLQEQRFDITAKLGSDGVLKGHIHQKYHGDSEIPLRATLRQTPQAKWKEFIQRFSYALGFAGDVSNVVVSPVEDLSHPLEVSYDYDRKDYADWEHKQILAALPPFGIEPAAGKYQKAPKEPFPLGALGDILYHSEIELPPGSSLNVPKDLNIVEPYAEYHTTNTLEMGELKVTRRFLLKKTEVPDSDWDGFKKLAKAVSDDEFNFLPLSGVGNGVVGSSQDGTVDLDRKFNEGTKALQRRDFQRAKELFQQVLAAEPKYRGAHFNLGMACVSQNQPTEGLAEFHKEEEVSPDDTQSMQAAAKLEMYLHRDEDAMQDWKKVQKVDPKNHDAALAIGQFLSSQEKYSEAAEVLEDALQSAPDSPSLRVLLGDAYLKGGKFDKAFPLLRAAADGAEKSKTVDSMILNNIAYELAEANTSLDFAKQCAEKALAELDSQSSSPSGRGLRLTQQYSPAWDTAGWVYFKLGDYKRAENYVHASWLLGQQRTVGEHLGEIYEKLGMPKEAAHVYELAYVAGGASMPGTFGRTSPARVLKGYEGSEKTLKERYHKLTGKALEDSTFSIHRSPNGQWPVSPSEELSRMREVKLGTHSGPSGSADFELIFAVGEPAVVKFVGGSDAMRSMSARLAAAKFRLEFPMDAKATLVRRVTLHCGPYEACSAVMMPLD